MFRESNGTTEQAGQPQPLMAAAGGLLLLYALWSRSWQSAVAGPSAARSSISAPAGATR
jgi:hypothetical protein